MERVKLTPRKNADAEMERLEFHWHKTEEGERYWNESACWKFTSDEIDHLEEATDKLWDMVKMAVNHAVVNKQLPLFGYDESTIKLIEWSWANESHQPTLYSRLDLAYDGTGTPKLLEINGDTPTSLYEAGVVQWSWLEAVFPDMDQFNSAHDKFQAVLNKLAYLQRTQVTDDGADGRILHLASVAPHPEDEGNIGYVNWLATEAGLTTKFVPVDKIGWRRYEAGTADHFVDQDDLKIRMMFKLYPWEWLLTDEFGKRLPDEVMSGRIVLIEPAWKMLASNKRLLATLWELFPFNPYLLPASTDRSEMIGAFASKPFLGREGQSVRLWNADGTLMEEQEGSYDADGVVYQQYAQLARADGRTAVIGSWIIDGKPAGIGIRESKSLITNNVSQFVPHYFVPEDEE